MPLTAPAARPVPASQDDVRRHNLGRLLSLLHVRGATSRADLTALTGRNRSTVKALTAELVDAGLAVESAPVGRGGAGRPSITVEPASEHVYVLSVDLGVERLTAVRVGLGGVVLDRRSLRQTPGDFSVPSTLARLSGLLRVLLEGAPADGVCVGIGVGVCGVVSADDGTVRFAPNLGWVDVPLRDLMSEVLDTRLPIDLGNDGDVGAIAEHLRGAGRGVSDMVFVAGEVGIGGGVIVGGRPFRGAGGYAGEVGHMSVDPKGRVCRCGRRGCWETEISDQALLLATGAPDGVSLEQVLTAYAAGERWALPGVRRVGRSLGTGVANLVNIFNPELIVFGGAVRHIFSATEPLVREALAGALAAPGERVRLAVAGLDDDSVLLGAAELAFGPLLEDPLGLLSVHRQAPAGAGA
ncbi:MAG: ROK family protein [Actinomycetota bacterium]|nr:ROK family protein [Actinomycetota bacterium]